MEKKKPNSLYQNFISTELRRQRKKHPGLNNKEYMKLAAEEWNKYKEKNGMPPTKKNPKKAAAKTAKPAKSAAGKKKKAEEVEEEESD